MLRTLQNAAETANLDAWRAAWLALDQDFFAPAALVRHLQKAGSDGLRISLCGLNSVQTYAYEQESKLMRLKSKLLKSFNYFRSPKLPELLLNL